MKGYTIPVGRRPGVFPVLDKSLIRRGLQALRWDALIPAQMLAAFVEPPRFQGGTLNDLAVSGAYTGTVRKDVIVKVSTVGATDKIKYSVDDGRTWSAEVALTGAAQALLDGIQITAAVTGHALGDEWRFSAFATPSGEVGKVSEVYSDGDASELFGFGSIAARMAAAALKVNAGLPVFVSPMIDGDGAGFASCSAALSGSAAGPGIWRCHVNGGIIEGGVETGAAVADVAIAAQNKIAKDKALPVTINVDPATPGKLLFKSKCAGPVGNSTKVWFEVTAPGISVVLTAMSGGTVQPALQGALDVAKTRRFKLVISQFNEATELTTLRTYAGEMSQPSQKKWTVVYFARLVSPSDSIAVSTVMNTERMAGALYRYTSNSKRQAADYEMAAALAAARSLQPNPAIPVNKHELTGMPPCAPEDELLISEQESCLYNGVSPLITEDGKVKILRLITTNVNDEYFLDVTKIDSADYLSECATAILEKLPNMGNTKDAKAVVWGKAYSMLLAAEEQKIVRDVARHKDKLSAVDDPNDATGMVLEIPSEIVPPLQRIYPVIRVI